MLLLHMADRVPAVETDAAPRFSRGQAVKVDGRDGIWLRSWTAAGAVHHLVSLEAFGGRPSEERVVRDNEVS